MRKNTFAIATIGMLLMSAVMIMPTTIASDDNSVVIHAPSEVIENTIFVIQVIDEITGYPYMAEITVGWNNETYFTNTIGEAVLIAPEVDQTKNFTITAIYGPFPPVTIWITILDMSDKDILYVGGYGSGNYSTIQDAIDAASNGNTVFVYSGIYYEDVIINKSINLFGEDKENTIVNGNGGEFVFNITTDYVNVSGFTIQNGSLGIEIFSGSNNIITDNIVKDNSNYGISVYGLSNDSIIYHNDFINNAIHAMDSANNTYDDGDEGNYWDDYLGEDNNSDGIGDTPYNISGGDNQDLYPLMEPYGEDEEEPPEEDTTPPVIHSVFPGKGLYINGVYKLPRIIRMPLIIGDITIKVNATDNESGIKRVNFTIDPLRPLAKQVGNDTTAPYTYTWTKNVIFRFIHVHTIIVTVEDNAHNVATTKMIVRRIL